MKNILSIDFDIIMEPSIQFYNNMTQISWEERSAGSNYADFLIANYNIYHKLTEHLLNLSSKINRNNIHFIFDHQHIINFLNPKEEHLIINIDHHHDRGYPQKDNEKIKDQSLNCGNWVNFVPNLYKYIWIKNPNSISSCEDNIIDGINVLDFNLDTLIPPDELFICFSIPWIPPSHHCLFYLWMDMLNTIYNTHFDFEE